eukprot:s281_g39.t1
MAPFLIVASLLAPAVVKAAGDVASPNLSSESSASSAAGSSSQGQSEHSEHPEPDANAGLLAFKSWELLDPSSKRALDRANRQPYQHYLSTYVSFYEAGRAQELMPDPFFSRHEKLEPRFGPSLASLQGTLQTSGAQKVPPAMDALPDGGCRFEEGHDYTGIDILTIPGSTQEQCCRACRRFNQRSPGTCAVAVLSSEHDDPPMACWVKSQIQAAVPKQGVVACIPEEKKKGITVFLVANKIDKDPLADETIKTRAAARAFAEIKELPYFEVSALKFIRVRKVFREMVEHIVLQPQLWSSDSLKEFYQNKKKVSLTQENCALQ